MTITSAGMTTALQGLQEAVDTPQESASDLDAWRWAVQERMAAVRDLLVAETDVPGGDWQLARGGSVLRERNALLYRLSALESRTLANPQVGDVRCDLERFVVDVTHHVQRLHDLAYDAVELELGGSE